MKTVKLISRIVLGLILLIFGLNNFFHFMPYPEMSESAGKFMGALADTGYIFPIVAGLEVLTGISLLINKYVALSLIIIFPIMVNAFIFHVFLDIPGIAASLIAIALNIFLFFVHKESYRGILKMNA